MSIATKRIPLAAADNLCERLLAALSPACERIQVAGSIRRRKPDIGDIELVAIARHRPTGLFGEKTESELDACLAGLVNANRLQRIKGGEKYQQFLIGSGERVAKLDLWICRPETWGVIFAIRTGSAEFAKSLVTEKCRGGRLRDGLVVREGRVWNGSEVMVGMIDAKNYSGPFFQPLEGATPLPTPEEADFLELAGGWVEPSLRT